eukprot:jgi/Orpsp1_1/1176416/evm.model.c7180000057507.1
MLVIMKVIMKRLIITILSMIIILALILLQIIVWYIIIQMIIINKNHTQVIIYLNHNHKLIIMTLLKDYIDKDHIVKVKLIYQDLKIMMIITQLQMKLNIPERLQYQLLLLILHLMNKILILLLTKPKVMLIHPSFSDHFLFHLHQIIIL